jgi:hypothetical protein
VAWIVCVHGVGKQVLGEQLLLRDWGFAFADGLMRAGAALVRAGDVGMAFYGDLFGGEGERLGVGDPFCVARDVEPGVGQGQMLLLSWWQEAAVAPLYGAQGPPWRTGTAGSLLGMTWAVDLPCLRYR